MKKNLLKLNTVFLVILVFVMSACSLQNRITGTWQITNYSEQNVNGSNANSVDIGTIQFKRNGTGINDLEYKIMGSTKADKSNFKYEIGDKFITIDSDDENTLAKSWIVIENKAKMQRWKSTLNGTVQTLELKKQ